MIELKKARLGSLEKCYAVTVLQNQGQTEILFASEDRKNGLLFSQKKEKEWTSEEIPLPGGVMTIRKWPGKEEWIGFLCGFYPPFLAQNAEIILKKKGENRWESKQFLTLPYLHRFEIVPVPEGYDLILSVLCREKQNKDDWESPGYEAVMHLDPNGKKQSDKIELLLDGQYHNHGMWKGILEGKQVILTASDQGVYAFSYGKQGWQTEHLFSEAAGEAAAFDLDGDGEDEIVTIAPFHGNQIKIYKKLPFLETDRDSFLKSDESEKRWQQVWTSPEPMEFSHALWAGWFHGERICFCGYRRGKKGIAAIYCKNGSWKISLLDKNVGCSNLCVEKIGKEEWLFCANHGIGECAFYK